MGPGAPESSCTGIDDQSIAGVCVPDLAASQEDVATIQGVFLALPLQAPDEVVHSAVGFLTHHLPCGQPSVQGATSMVQLSHPSSILVGGGGLRECSYHSPARAPAWAPHYPKPAPMAPPPPLYNTASSWMLQAGRSWPQGLCVCCLLWWYTHLLREALLDPPVRYGPPRIEPLPPCQCLMSPDVYSCSHISNVCEGLPWWSSG